jgi:GH15 family glucan-1,4-alpha-glucosidase
MQNLDYGVIGNCTSAALISQTGNIVWCCLPYFNSPSLFAKLLDKEKGGEFGFMVVSDYKITQYYFKNTNILCTRFSKGEDAFEVIDYMPRHKTDRVHYHCPPDIVRYIHYISGNPELRVIYKPRLVYAQHETKNNLIDNYIKSYTVKGPYESIYLYSDFPLKHILSGEKMHFTEDHYFLLSYNQKLLPLTINKIYFDFERTKVYWLDWVDRTVTLNSYSDAIIRSALVLKLLSFQKTGAILAAVTTSLPEILGGIRNWDYRFCWIRDASMIISVLKSLNHHNVAARFLKFVLDIIPFKDEKMQIMYGIRGEKKLIEKELSWLSGYEGSRPVRIGNGAYLQKQNDIYGVLLDVIYFYFKEFRHTLAISEDLWTMVRSLLRTLEKHWMKSDKSIWEFRSNNHHFTFSKVLSWVAFDRGQKIAALLGKPSYALKWQKIKASIKKNIYLKGWNPDIGAFTQTYGGKAMDAANLLMQSYGFIEANDQKYVSTVKRIKDELCVNGLLFRYRTDDDFGRPQTAFTVCTFWMIKSLFLIGEQKEARTMFDNLLTHTNHLGLLSEGMDFKSKRLLGNFPQGYSHLALIDAALTLSGETGGTNSTSKILYTHIDY